MNVRTRGIVGAAMVALVSACVTAPMSTSPAPVESPAALQARFDSVIGVAAVYRPEHVLPLRPAIADARGRLRVATYTSWAGYQPGETTLARDVWVTVVPELRDSCLTFPDDELTLRLEQLLGLPPGDGNDRIVEMEVAAADVFRPAADPTITSTLPCPANDSTAPCGTRFPPGTPATHVQWIADATLNLWRIPQGYPWTRLGYTYNWHPGSPRYGASEYVVRSGASVRVLSVTPTAAYCS